MLNRTVAPPIVDAVNFDLQLKPYTKYKLDNGIDVFAINAGAEEVIGIEWVFFAGNSYEEQNLVAATTNFLLKNGTTKKSAFQINEHFEYYGAFLNRSCQHETASITLHCLTKHVHELLPAVKELMTDSIMPAEELIVYQQNMIQRLKVSLKKCEFVASRLIDASLYGLDHPYGRYGMEEDYAALKREELLAYYKKYYLGGKFLLFVAGKLPSNLEKLLNDNFGDLANKKVDALEIALKPGKEKKTRIINDPEGVQAAIRIARPFPNRLHPDFQKVQVLNILLGGFFGSRLMNNIREDKGYTYGIHSYLQNLIQHSAWMISTEAGKDVCDATIGEVYKEMQLLREELVDEEELSLVKNYMMGSILGELDGPFQIISRWKNLILNGLDESYFNKSLATIKSISAEDLKELANKYLHPEQFYELVVV